MIIAAIRSFTSACEWLSDAMFSLSASSYDLVMVWDFLLLKVLNPLFSLGDKNTFLFWVTFLLAVLHVSFQDPKLGYTTTIPVNSRV